MTRDSRPHSQNMMPLSLSSPLSPSLLPLVGSLASGRAKVLFFFFVSLFLFLIESFKRTHLTTPASEAQEARRVSMGVRGVPVAMVFVKVLFLLVGVGVAVAEDRGDAGPFFSVLQFNVWNFDSSVENGGLPWKPERV